MDGKENERCENSGSCSALIARKFDFAFYSSQESSSSIQAKWPPWCLDIDIIGR